jgi:hypothetical protein
MKPETKANLERLIMRIDAMLAGMYAGLGDEPDWRDYEASKAWRLRKSGAIAAMRQTLLDEEGARFGERPPHDHAMTLGGVSSSCTAGWEGLFRNWKNAARRRIEKDAAS